MSLKLKDCSICGILICFVFYKHMCALHEGRKATVKMKLSQVQRMALTTARRKTKWGTVHKKQSD